MSTGRITSAIFDMDGLLIDSEPLWLRGELEVFSQLGLNVHDDVPETLGLRIDQVVRIWYLRQPWQGPSQQVVCQRILDRVLELVRETRPLLPGVVGALQLCRTHDLHIGLASASPLAMLQEVLSLFQLEEYFDHLISAEHLPYSKPHPDVYLRAAQALNSDPLDCVTLEDSFNGMIAAKAARMRSIVVPAAICFDDPRWALADVKLPSLAQLKESDLQP
ncbi:hexitol phosphatase HxpB [Edwardsiella ictaluri]|uniref:HAD-superfamily hydrolase, subfamily IA, variant 3 n=1 Tax=Edwardsiella ictaluri (strain 93-146) TaxID=634503 RepID=C5BDZ3_EDWI9|nr:hexitol phosphatase HxpB [Edwardsiella ictaluri]ACR68913.1 HAD-superfamily hydrolase, subfamily IA, variant 3 [Edwardsiella ictaluri 93-146]AVZ83951.1 hexitol phosphatase HxpB [Edwardsiella ictaluri]EKS7764374.1 hexitol phosphatase HxpB [Edwardsiella ictaluri]EKS7771271.1 hexitol phosphatase HxpB [Edwardsiella ictaluri]EKS7774426.1 hexitol phosphatase HxpB [Edwardsiella ictaluri]